MQRTGGDDLGFPAYSSTSQRNSGRLNPQPGHVIADGTVGGGGHALEIIQRILPEDIISESTRTRPPSKRQRRIFTSLKVRIH
jgi:16S rRNA C1402 N4-methylase RsmH